MISIIILLFLFLISIQIYKRFAKDDMYYDQLVEGFRNIDSKIDNIIINLTEIEKKLDRDK